MTTISGSLADNYFQARADFLESAAGRGAHVRRYEIEARGPDGETLTIDTAYFGAAEPKRLLLVLCGTHGVEGFAGSAIQRGWLRAFDASALSPTTGVLLVHAVNPYGFAWLRRTNENNVDLNRNALDQFPGPINDGYRRLNEWLNPPAGRRWDFFHLRGLWALVRFGLPTMKQAIASGQYQFPRGIFYGGDRQETSTRILYDLVRAPAFAQAQRVVAIDIHTGLGRCGTYKLLVDLPEDSEAYRQMQRWHGADRVSGNRPERSISYQATGGITNFIERSFPTSVVFASVLEFGTTSQTRTLMALRDENHAHFHLRGDNDAYRRTQAALLEVAWPSNPGWRAQTIEHGVQVLCQAQQLLGN